MARVDFLAGQIRKIEAERILRVLQHKPQFHDPIAKLCAMGDGNRVVRRLMSGDVHGAIPEIDLFMPSRSRLAVCIPIMADLVRQLLGFLPVEMILKKQGAAFSSAESSKAQEGTKQREK